MKKTTFGVIIGNRDFFPDRLVTEARIEILNIFKEMGYDSVLLPENETKLGGVETYSDAKKCAALFKANREKIDGIIVILPNFGDEKGVAETINLSGLNVPILVQAYPDNVKEFTVERRRDAFCGKISVCNNLKQYGFPYTITKLHTVSPSTPEFKQDLKKFAGVCRVVNGLRKARIGAVGARPGNFNTVRYSEKILQKYGIGVVTVDLSEIIGNAQRLNDTDAAVTEFLKNIKNYIPTSNINQPPLVKMAKLGVALDKWIEENEISATAIQCWTSIQKNYGINVCTLMSMMSERMMPSGCEVDITGVVSMLALQLASENPTALVDWNNNYGNDPNTCVLFHCGNWAKSFFNNFNMASAEILATTLGTENTCGAVAGRVKAGPMTFARITTDDTTGRILSYVGEGEFTDDALDTFGSRAVVKIPNMQALLQNICKNGFEHHTAMSFTHSAEIIREAFETYFGWNVYKHS